MQELSCRVSRDASPFSLEVPARHRDGHDMIFEIRPARLTGTDGEVEGFRGVAVDITERKKAEDALHLANRKLNLLTSITRHDINNQLTVLQAYCELLEENETDFMLNEYCRNAMVAAQRISSIIQFTKEYGEIGITAPTWQNLRVLLETATAQAPPGEIVVENRVPGGMEVFADPLVVKVFYNLMDNAVRYGGNITTIRLSVEDRNNDKIIVCEDDGIGVSADEKEQIFEPGFGKNTGLGLALSRDILAITGITIHENGETGKGARFEITVPRGAYRFAGR
jgi:signal transduction histidine kinase